MLVIALQYLIVLTSCFNWFKSGDISGAAQLTNMQRQVSSNTNAPQLSCKLTRRKLKWRHELIKGDTFELRGTIR